jgi:hypothetical protein
MSHAPVRASPRFNPDSPWGLTINQPRGKYLIALPLTERTTDANHYVLLVVRG